MKIPVWSQRDPRWAKQQLGTVRGTTLGGYGCLITSIAMVDAAFDPKNPWNPSQVNNWFTQKGGYTNGNGSARSPKIGCNLVVYGMITKLLPNSVWQGMHQTFSVPADVKKIKKHIDAGGLCILQVGFGGVQSKMHFVLAVGYNGDDIIFHDPWYGDKASFKSKRYGSGSSAKDILVTHFFKDATPAKPAPKPVAPAPATKPAPKPVPAEPAPAPKPTPAPQDEAKPPVTPEPESLKPRLDELEAEVKRQGNLLKIIWDYLLRWKRFREFVIKITGGSNG